jgi:ABC-type dipeptide/oligopeptide/nickel transport system permease component
VLDLMLERLPSTLELAGFSMLLAVVAGLTFGLVAALKRNTPIDGLVMAVSLGGVSMPSFWFALLLILVFSVGLGLLPATGSGTFLQLILPAVALGYEGVALIARLTRASVLEVMSRQYMTTARAKGLPPVDVILRHAFRSALSRSSRWSDSRLVACSRAV